MTLHRVCSGDQLHGPRDLSHAVFVWSIQPSDLGCNMPLVLSARFRTSLAQPTRRSLLLAALAAVACEPALPFARGRHRIQLWFTYGGRNRERLEALVAAFHRSQREIFVQTVFQGDYFEGLAKLRVALAARAAPALSHVVGEVVPYLVEAGALAPLDRYLEPDKLDLLPALSQAGSWIGGADHPFCVVPFNRSTPIAYLNGALFSEADLAPPTTWDELRACARRLTSSDPHGPSRYGFACPIDWWFWAALTAQAGGSVVERDGRISLGGRAGELALEFWQQLALRDRCMKPPPGRDYNAWEQTNQDFLAGRVAMIWTSTAFLRYLEDNARFPVIATPLPARDRLAVPTGGTHWLIPRDTPADDQRAAAQFLKFMLTPERAAEWALGTGYIPVTRGAVAELERDGHYQRHPNDRVALAQLAHAEPWPWSPQLFRIQREVLQPRLEAAVFFGSSPSTLLAEARRLAVAT